MSHGSLAPRSGPTRTLGAVLIFSLGVLAMMAITAVALCMLSRIERNVSRNYVDQVRAKMLASAGVERVLASLAREVADPATLDSHRFYGEDLNANGVADPGEDANGNGWEEQTCPLYRALHPSYMLDVNRDGRFTSSDLVTVDGTQVGATGILPSTYTAQGDFFSVKVTDVSRRINVNMFGHPQLQAILENLCQEAGLGRAVGTRLYLNRPYGSLLEIRDRCGLNSAQFETLKNLVTVYGWYDKKVVNAVPLNQRNRSLSVGSYVYTWEEFRPRSIDFPRDSNNNVVGRCPVNLNLAPREVLVALLWNLSGYYLNEESRGAAMNSGYAFMGVSYTYSGSNGALGQVLATPPISQVKAEQTADAIIRHRVATPFRSWQDFNDFLWNEVFTRGILDRRQIDCCKANFNPNSNINDFNPEYFRFAWVDKSDLSYWTTEFCFAPTGYYQIESIGRVLDGFRNTVSEAELLVDTKMFDIYRETTQKDFLMDYWQNGAPLDRILSRERGAGTTKGGLSLTTFPEPPEVAWVRDADWDGHITLATKRSLAAAPFRATYENSMNADTGQGQVRDRNGPDYDRMVGPRGGSGAWRPGKLFPDGVYAELDSVPMYGYAPSNINSFHTSFWIKPHFFPEHAGRSRVFLTWQKTAGAWWWPVTPLGIYCTVTSYVEDRSNGGYEYQEAWDTPAFLGGGTVGQWEGACASPCINHLEHGHSSISRGGQTWGTMFEGGKWCHVGWTHDAQKFVGRGYEYPGTHHEDMDVLFINGRKVDGVFSYQTGDVSFPTNYGGEGLRLGERRSTRALNSVPDSTMDEVIVWDGSNLRRSEQDILGEYGDGRFYRDDDGTFTSRAVDLAQEVGGGAGESVWLAMLQWTQYVPTSLPNGRVRIEVVRASNGRPLTGTGIYDTPGGDKVGVTVNEPIRYVVHFEPRAPGSTPLVDTLVFDDITFIVLRGPQFLSWAWAPGR